MIPISDIQMLIIDNYKLVLSAQLINKLAEANVCVIICGLNHLPTSYISPLHGYYAQTKAIMSQIGWSDDIKGEMTKTIIEAKILNQLRILKKNRLEERAIELLTQYKDEVVLGDITNREGLASKVYFRAMYGNEFTRFAEDTINAALNYGYAIFRSQITSLIISKGLLPNLGLFHIGKTNHNNLSDDIIEVFRPIVDDYVFIKLKLCDIFTIEHRQALVRLVTKTVSINGQYQTIGNAMLIFIESVLKCIEMNNTSHILIPSPVIKDEL